LGPIPTAIREIPFSLAYLDARITSSKEFPSVKIIIILGKPVGKLDPLINRTVLFMADPVKVPPPGYDFAVSMLCIVDLVFP
jgi:hypothetical protein